MEQAFAEKVAGVLVDASANGSGSAQLALLKRAQADGEVTVELARQAQRAFAECAKAGGIEVTFTERTRPDGWISAITTVKSLGRSDAENIATQCDLREASWVLYLYDTQPLAVQATTDYLDQQAPALRACLEAAGFDPEPDDSGMELAILSTRTDDPGQRDAGVQCLYELGIDGF